MDYLAAMTVLAGALKNKNAKICYFGKSEIPIKSSKTRAQINLHKNPEKVVIKSLDFFPKNSESG